MLVWLDDRRDPTDYGCPGWTWARAAEQAIEFLATGRVDAISLDHDLGPTLTGNDVLKWMQEHEVWPPHGVFVHSSNNSAAESMRLAIDARYPDLARFRVPYMTQVELAAMANFLVKRSME